MSNKKNKQEHKDNSEYFVKKENAFNKDVFEYDKFNVNESFGEKKMINDCDKRECCEKSCGINLETNCERIYKIANAIEKYSFWGAIIVLLFVISGKLTNIQNTLDNLDKTSHTIKSSTNQTTK